MKTLKFTPAMIQQINPGIVQEAARQAALDEAARPKLNLLGILGIVGICVAGVMVFRAR